MDEKLYISLIFSKLMVCKRLNANCLHMSNLIANFVRIIGICKDFAGNSVEEFGKCISLWCGLYKFSGLEVIASSIATATFYFDSENFDSTNGCALHYLLIHTFTDVA